MRKDRNLLKNWETYLTKNMVHLDKKQLINKKYLKL